MKFVTEMELRETYGKEPYAAYIVEDGTRLTPGARQFLIDRSVEIIDKCTPPIKATNIGTAVRPAIATTVSARLASGNIIVPQGKSAAVPSSAACKLPPKDWRRTKLYSTLVSVEAEFLRTEVELLSTDVMLAQQVAELGKQFRMVRASAERGGEPEIPDREYCGGIHAEDISGDGGDCVEITEFHAQLPNGRKIVLLFALHAALLRIEPTVYEYCEMGGGDENKCRRIISRVREIAKAVTQLIRETVGGRECLRM